MEPFADEGGFSSSAGAPDPGDGASVCQRVEERELVMAPDEALLSRAEAIAKWEARQDALARRWG